MTIHAPIHLRSARTLLADLMFGLGMLAPRNWLPRYEYHEGHCALRYSRAECTCSRSGAA